MSFDFGGSGGGSGWGDAPPPPPPRQPGDGQSDGWDQGTTPDPGAGGAPGPVLGFAPVSPPLLWLGLAGLAAVVAIVVGVALDGFVMSFVGWVIGGFVAIGLFAVYLKNDIAARAGRFYAETATAEWGRRVVVALALVAVALNAWGMADVISRGGLS